MEKQVCFGYESIENFVKLLTTIRFEKTHSNEEIAIWHERFDDVDGDELFGSFLTKMFPNGKTIDVEDIETIMNHAIWFLEKDDKARHIKNNSVKRHNSFWVYFKPDDVVYPCEYAEHAKTVEAICIDFFKDFDDLDADYLKNFILQNFEIRSDMSTIERIAKDYQFIYRSIIFSKEE